MISNNRVQNNTYKSKLKIKGDKPTDKIVLSLLTTDGPLTRSQLVVKTGLARSTLYDSLMRLDSRGLLSQFSNKSSGPGRPKVFFCIQSET